MSAAERRSPDITPASPGAFLNYQLSAQQIDGQNIGGAFAELGLFAGAGVLTSTAVARYGNDDNQLVRLDTTYTRDFPATLETLNLGDDISDGGSWGNAVRYAGLRWSRNFGLRPDLLTTPLLATSGTATVPSTVDVFVNNQLVTSSQLPPGPFVIDRLPTVSGTGDVSVVVRDALGREEVLTQSFYSSVTLLAQGLSQYSVNLGKIRDNYALESNDYGPMLGEASYRRGITDAITLEGHAEYLAGDAHAAGLNAAFGLGQIGVINFTGANGGDTSGSGWLSGVGFEHRGTNTSFVASSLWASSDFSQVGEPHRSGHAHAATESVADGNGAGKVRLTIPCLCAADLSGLAHPANAGADPQHSIGPSRLAQLDPHTNPNGGTVRDERGTKFDQRVFDLRAAPGFSPCGDLEHRGRQRPRRTRQ